MGTALWGIAFSPNARRSISSLGIDIESWHCLAFDIESRHLILDSLCRATGSRCIEPQYLAPNQCHDLEVIVLFLGELDEPDKMANSDS